ncbi:ubiquitin carboxyl-terminal hydrolase [Lasius niger]|uniref:Ubiquitin carboxyl-terminal hydrolase n=1 Tax=Lasius niger TaxID=67767 RepID=A0A0J7N222_LASNI|nr:ubiquitin carboxyl-terminal hydrolase [Lasius niger]
MSEQIDIITAINELLGDPEYWDQALPLPPRADHPPLTPAPTQPPRAPKVGTIIQRSDHVNRRKQEMLMTIPPPPPKRPRGRTTTADPSATGPSAAASSSADTSTTDVTTDTAAVRPVLLMPTGPLPPPPIPVQIEPGIIIDVPHFCVHVSRKYKARTPHGRWVLRFSRTGQLRYHRKIA